MNKPKSLFMFITLPAILLIAVLLRVAVAFYYGNIVDAPPLLTDQRSYHGLGMQVLEGQGFSFPRAWYPFTPANTPTAHWSFLYSLIVAAIYGIFGAHPLAMRLFQAIAGGILLPTLVYRLTKILFFYTPSHPLTPAPTRPRPLIAAGCAAVYGYFILYAATIMTETFYITALLWSLEVSLRMGAQLRAGKPVSWKLAIELGLSLGIAALLRQSILPWAPVLFLWLLLNIYASTRSHTPAPTPPRTLAHPIIRLCIAGLILITCIAPFTYRNYRVYGEFLLLNSNTGYALYSAQHPMHGTHFREFEAAPLPPGLEGLNEAQADKVLLRQGFQFILDEPGRYLLLSLSRVRAYFEFWPTPDSTLVHNLGRVGSFGLFLPFMLYGLVLNLKISKSANPKSRFTHHASRITHYALRITEPASLLYLFIIFYSLLHICTWAMVRYRLPVDAVLLPFAAVAIETLFIRYCRSFFTR